MEQRVTRLESNVDNINSSIDDIKTDLGAIRTDVSSQYKLGVGATICLASLGLILAWIVYEKLEGKVSIVQDKIQHNATQIEGMRGELEDFRKDWGQTLNDISTWINEQK